MIINNINDTKAFAEKLAKDTKAGTTYGLVGDLAAGKTTFTKYFINSFIKNVDVISPTFNIIKSYNISNNDIKQINHFDVYRLKNEEELIEIGYYDYINDKNAINIIEWADLIKDKLPDNTIFIEFKHYNNDINKREVLINGK